MTFDLFWDDVRGNKWLQALSLPTLAWAEPFLPFLGLPHPLLEHLELWKSIYRNVIVAYESQLQVNGWSPLTYEEQDEITRLTMHERRSELTRLTITNAFQQLSSQIGQEISVALERWVWLHFFCPEFSAAMNEWEVVLRYAYLSPDSRRGHRKVLPPIALIPLLPDLLDLVSLERRKEIRQALKQVSPPPLYEQIPYEQLEQCYEFTLLTIVIDQSLTLQALQSVATRLNASERLAVVTWAEIQLQTMKVEYAHPEKLCGEKYLQPEMLFSGIPLPKLFHSN